MRSEAGRGGCPAHPSPLRQLADQVEGWQRSRLLVQVAAALVLGALIGLALDPARGWVSPATAEHTAAWLALPGKIVLGLLSTILVPLVLASIVVGLAGDLTRDELRMLGGKLALFTIVATAFSATLGIGLARALEPGAAVRAALLERPSVPARAVPSISDRVFDALPEWPVVAAAERWTFTLVFAAILFGLACRASRRERTRPVLLVLDGLIEIAMTVYQWAAFLLPWAALGLAAELTARAGLSAVLASGTYVLTVVLGFAVLAGLHLVLAGAVSRRGARVLLADIARPAGLALATSGTAPVMPLAVETATERLRCPEALAALVIPLCSAVGLAATVLYQAVAVGFLAQAAGVDLAIADHVLVVLALALFSIGAPGKPGVSMVIVAHVAVGFGIPATGLVLVFGLDRLLDPLRAATGLSNDLATCVVLSPSGPVGEEEPVGLVT